MCAGWFRGHKSSNRIELSSFVLVIVILPIWAQLWGVGQVGLSGVISYSLMSLGMFRGKENRIISISSGLIEFCCFGLPAALGRGHGVGGCLGGIWGHGGCPLHTRTCMHTHAHAHTHMYTCIEIANGCQHGGIHV